jgi:hypothetical protein
MQDRRIIESRASKGALNEGPSLRRRIGAALPLTGGESSKYLLDVEFCAHDMFIGKCGLTELRK